MKGRQDFKLRSLTFLLLLLLCRDVFFCNNRRFITGKGFQHNLCCAPSKSYKGLGPTKVGQLFPEVENARPVLHLHQVLHAVKPLLLRRLVFGFPKVGQHVRCAREGGGHGRVRWEEPRVPQGGRTLGRQGYLRMQLGQWTTLV